MNSKLIALINSKGKLSQKEREDLITFLKGEIPDLDTGKAFLWGDASLRKKCKDLIQTDSDLDKIVQI